MADPAGGQSKTWEGYGTVRGDLGTAPILQASGISTATLFAYATGTSGSIIRNIAVDGASLTSIQGFSFVRRGTSYFLRAVNCTNIGINVTAGNILIKCSATNTTGGAAGIVYYSAILCESYANTVPGFVVSSAGGPLALWCLSYGNTGASSDGFVATASTGTYASCSAYGNGRDGFRFALGEANQAINCIAESNTGVGFNATSAVIGALTVLSNCAAYLNTGGNIATNLTGPQLPAVIVGSGSFFTNAAASDFSLNNTAGAGALLRAAGIPGVYPSGLTTGYQDIGAAQHADPVSGGGRPEFRGGNL